MSTVTKIFLVLLVVVSMLNAAAVVVFVNKGQTAAEQGRLTMDQLTTARSERDAARASDLQHVASMNTAKQLLANMAATQDSALKAAEASLAQVQDQLKSEQVLNTALNANNQSLTDQLAIALKTNQDNSKTINDLRDAYAKQNQALADSDAALAHQTQLAQTYGRQVEYLKEVNVKLEEQIHAGPQPGGPAAAPVAAAQINGSVRDKSTVNGVTYLTISVGTADGVQNGMQFSVVGAAQPPQFLGILTIVQTDVNSATGRLQADAPMIAKVKQGDEVTTNLQ